MKKILTVLALLWGLPAAAQGIPTGGEGSLCIATANAPTLAQGNFAVLSCDLSGNLRTSTGVSQTMPQPIAQVGVTRTGQKCTLPAYATGGNIVCTNEAGQQTTVACAANTACLVSGANANRKVAHFMNRTVNTTIDIGFSSSVAPGNTIGIDGPGATGGQGGTHEDSPAHVGAYYAASPVAATLVFVQGQ